MKFFRHISLRLTRSTAPSQQQRGQAALETALVLPILLILITGIVMVGFIMYAYNQVSNAAREGTRAGSVYQLTRANSGLTLDATVRNAIYNPNSGSTALGALPINASTFVVTSNDVICQLYTKASGYTSTSDCSTADPRPGDRLTVQVTYRYTVPVISGFLTVFPQPIVIVRNVMMEVQ